MLQDQIVHIPLLVHRDI